MAVRICSTMRRRVDVLGVGLVAAGVDEPEAAIEPLDVGLDAVAGGSRLVFDDCPAFAENAVEDRRLAHVWPADDDNAGQRSDVALMAWPARRRGNRARVGLGFEARGKRCHGDRIRSASPDRVGERDRRLDVV